MNETQQTFLLLLIFGAVDFCIHYPLFENHPERKTWQDIYHVIQATTQAVIPLFVFEIGSADMYLFYFLLFAGVHDMVYIIIWWLIKDESYPEKCWWLWWTFPLGWIATILDSIKAKREGFGFRFFLKGTIKFSHFKIQVASAIIIYFVLKYWLINS